MRLRLTNVSIFLSHPRISHRAVNQSRSKGPIKLRFLTFSERGVQTKASKPTFKSGLDSGHQLCHQTGSSEGSGSREQGCQTKPVKRSNQTSVPYPFQKGGSKPRLQSPLSKAVWTVGFSFVNKQAVQRVQGQESRCSKV